jgi:general stress protein 26
MADRTHNDLGKLVELIGDIRFTMFTTHADGRHRARPMTTLKSEPDGSLWFLGNRGSELIDEIAADPSVGLTYADAGAGTYVSVSGSAAAREDRARIKELWNPILNAWWDGPDDPAIQLIEVRVEAADYWDDQNNRLTRMIGILAAAVTGDEFDEGEIGSIEVPSAAGRR